MDTFEDLIRDLDNVAKRLEEADSSIPSGPVGLDEAAEALGIDLDDVAVDPDRLFDTPEEAKEYYDNVVVRQATKLSDGLGEKILEG